MFGINIPYLYVIYTYCQYTGRVKNRGLIVIDHKSNGNA